MQLSANSLPLPSSFEYYISISLSISISLTEITAGQKSFQLLCPAHVYATVMSILWINVDFHPGFCKPLRQNPWKGKERYHFIIQGSLLEIYLQLEYKSRITTFLFKLYISLISRKVDKLNNYF